MVVDTKPFIGQILTNNGCYTNFGTVYRRSNYGIQRLEEL
jgi:hypothetical protein